MISPGGLRKVRKLRGLSRDALSKKMGATLRQRRYNGGKRVTN